MRQTRIGPVLITGGAGFIGTNLAHRLLESGRTVILYDNLSRSGVDENLRWLRGRYGSRLQSVIGDITDSGSLRQVVRDAGQVFHFAAQVAVTTSLDDPVHDFKVNALGTLTLLEEMRRLPEPPPLVFTSTNKVYGGLEDLSFRLSGDRYVPEDENTLAFGIGENRPLDFHSPYGCSKGTADQYVIDYTRTFGLRAVVFRMSCIYGPHQCGNEDQGWVAHFLLQALANKKITLYGDGRQVRDILFVEDLVDAFLLAQHHMDRLTGNAFNMGGGPKNAISLLQLLDMIERLTGSKPPVSFSDWRPGDQRYYVSDFTKFSLATGWSPKFTAENGVKALYRWLLDDSQTDIESKSAKKKAAVML
jgi:CDP-paratose 2-epimerase